MKSTTLALMASACLVNSCSGSGETESFYVLVSPIEADRYYRDMIALVTLLGMDANPGTANDNRGHTLYVVEGTGRGVRVWSVNTVLSERESEACGGPRQTRTNPAQYVVTVSSRNPFRGEQVPAVTAELKSSLQAQGYEVRAEPWICRPDAAAPEL